MVYTEGCYHYKDETKQEYWDGDDWVPVAASTASRTLGTSSATYSHTIPTVNGKVWDENKRDWVVPSPAATPSSSYSQNSHGRSYSATPPNPGTNYAAPAAQAYPYTTLQNTGNVNAAYSQSYYATPRNPGNTKPATTESHPSFSYNPTSQGQGRVLGRAGGAEMFASFRELGHNPRPATGARRVLGTRHSVGENVQNTRDPTLPYLELSEACSQVSADENYILWCFCRNWESQPGGPAATTGPQNR